MLNSLLIAIIAGTTASCSLSDSLRKPDTKPTSESVDDVTSIVKAPGGKELCAMGVNFQTPLSWEANRLAKAGVHKTAEDLNKVTDNNISDVVLMGAKQLRCHLTPADFTDADGNLIETIYLDALDYLVYRAGQEGLLLSFAFLNHMGQSGPGKAWAGRGSKTWIHDPGVVDCTERYINQLLTHKNKYSGVAYKDIRHIAYWELINEPEMYSYSEIRESGYASYYDAWLKEKGKNDCRTEYAEYRSDLVRTYINRIYDSIRNCGDARPVCWGLNWHRFRKDNADIFKGVAGSKVEIAACCNYPGQDLVSKDYWDKRYDFTERSFSGWFNKYYKSADGYGWTIQEPFTQKAKVIYEFESFFNQSAYIYPVQALYFRALGAQAASMWTYTFSEIAPYYGGSHYLNLRYTPAKSASFIVAEKIFSSTPIGGGITVKDEMKGDNWCISKSHDAAIYSDSEWYCHSGATADGWSGIAPSSKVKHIRGIGDSPVAEYSGNGIYFLDDTDEGLEIRLMPDIEITGDRFASPDYKTIVTRLLEDNVNTLRIKLNRWKDSDCRLYEVTENGTKLIYDSIKGGSELRLKAGRYLLKQK